MTKKEMKALTPKEIEWWQMAANLQRKNNEMLTNVYRELADFIKPYQYPNGLLRDECFELDEYKRLSKKVDDVRAKVKMVQTMLFGKRIGSGINIIHQLANNGIITL